MQWVVQSNYLPIVFLSVNVADRGIYIENKGPAP